MELAKIFTKINIKILKLLTKGPYHIRDIASKLKVSPAKVHGAIELFQHQGFLREYKEKNRRVVKIDRHNPKFQLIGHLLGFDDEHIIEQRIGLFETISPLDFRYYGRNEKVRDKLLPYLSEEGFVQYLAKVEAALTNTLAECGICSKAAAVEVDMACKQVSAEEVYAEEDRIKHNIRALANVIRSKVSARAKPFVHFTTTSHDIICTADAARIKDFLLDVLIPVLIHFEETLITLAEREKSTLQIGRTHGQHAEPITFGFAIAQFVSRLGSRIVRLRRSANNLRGKVAGAVGAYNASSLFFADPESFEKQVLGKLKLKPSPISTQVVEAEYMADVMHAVTTTFGVLANLADDMRHLQRTEIAEIGEHFESDQVGSSTMPHKRNPINFENVKSMWKEFMPRMSTVYMDQICEHQRDLTNSASQRFVPELLAGLYVSIIRMDKTMKKLVVDQINIQKNFDEHKDMITAEPAYVLLSSHGHPDAHEYVRKVTLDAQSTGKPFRDLLFNDRQIQPYLEKFTKSQIRILKNPESYTGIAQKKTEKICSFWKKELKI